jgi:hypothetical protein
MVPVVVTRGNTNANTNTKIHISQDKMMEAFGGKKDVDEDEVDNAGSFLVKEVVPVVAGIRDST